MGLVPRVEIEVKLGGGRIDEVGLLFMAYKMKYTTTVNFVTNFTCNLCVTVHICPWALLTTNQKGLVKNKA